MKKKISCLFSSFLLASLFSFVAPGFSDDLIADDLIPAAKAFYEQGNYQRAIHEFSKVLLADPTNQEAKDYLKKMGLKEGLYGRQHPPLEKVTQMGQEIIGYEGQVSSLEQENQAKEEAKKKLEQEKEELARNAAQQAAAAQKSLEDAEQAKQKAEAQAAEKQKIADEMKAKAQLKEKEVVRLHTDLYGLKSRVLNAETAVNQEKQRLADAQQQLKSQLFKQIKDNGQERIQYQQQQIALERERDAIKHRAVQSGVETKQQLEELHRRLVEKTNEAQYTQDRLVISNYKLANTEKLVANKEEMLLEMQDAITQMQTRVEFLQKKVQEQRNAEAVALIGSSTNAGPTPTDFIKKQDKQIEELKAKLISAREELQGLQESGAKAGGETTEELKKQVAAASKQLAETKSQYENKDSEYQFLEKRLQDLQERLKTVEGLLKSRDEQIRTMDRQLMDGLQQMDGVKP